MFARSTSASLLIFCFAIGGKCLAQEPKEAKRADDVVEKFVAAGKDTAAKRQLVDQIRLLGAAGMEAIGRALDRNNAARGSTEGEARNLLLCEAWVAAEMVPYKEGTNWRTIYPERCFGGRRIVPPAGAVAGTKLLNEKDRKEFFGGVAEEYCERTGADGKPVRHGPYTLRGPNGEALEQGEYVEGRRAGTWITAYGGQFCECMYRGGKLDAATTKVIGYASRWMAIDFAAAHAQKGGMGGGLGSTWYTLGDVTADSCTLTVGGEVEMGKKEVVVYRVPRKLGRRTFDNSLTGLDLSPLDEYRVKGK